VLHRGSTARSPGSWLAAASVLLVSYSCWGGSPTCSLAAAAAGLAPIVAGRRWASGPLALLALMAGTLWSHASVAPAPAAVGAVAYTLSLLEEWSAPVLRELALPAAAAVYAGAYSWILYERLPGAVDLPATTRAAFGEPSSRVLAALLAGAYLAVVSYYLFSPQRRTPRLLGAGGLMGRLRTHKLAPLWLPLAYVISQASAAASAFSILAALIAAVTVYERSENLDAAFLAAAIASLATLKLVGP